MNRERKDELTELDLELAKMAQETPEMPADFHACWTEAVRAEAAGQQTEKKHETRRQWRYILSAAAVFVFLIGGTLITRGTKNDKVAKTPAMNESAAVVSEAAEDPDAGMPETNGAVLFAEAVKDANAFAGGAAPEAAAPAAQADFATEAEAAYDEAAEDAEAYDAAPLYEAAEAYEEEAAYETNAAYEAGAAYEDSAYAEEESVQSASSAREKSAAAGETAMSFGAGANKAAGGSMMPEPTAAATMAPEPTVKPTAEPAEEPAEAPAEEPEEEAADDSDSFTGFLKDLGIFTLKTAAVAAAGAALAFLIACIHRAWKKRKK